MPGIRRAITFIIATMVIISPVVSVISLAAASTSNRVDTSGHHANFPIQPAIPQQQKQSDVTTQAALQHPLLLPSNNIVNTRATYDIGFRTTTAGIIKTIEMAFPPGTIASNSLIEFAGIGPGLLTRPTVNSLLYTVFTPVNVPANTAIRLEVGFFNNPINPINAATILVTTRNTVGNIIDGPTSSNPYIIKQIGTTDIADDAITKEKVAISFAYERQLADGENGWNPDSSGRRFNIFDPLVSDQSRIVVNLDNNIQFIPPVCSVTNTFLEFESFQVACDSAVFDGTLLKYAVFNPATP